MFFNFNITKIITMQKKLQICSATEITKIMNRILLIICDSLTKT